MRSKKRPLFQTIVILAAFAMLMVYPSRCQAVNPSVPNFSVQYVDNSYYVPPTYRTDPYNGQTVMQSPGYNQVNQTIVVTIQNQPFTPYQDGNNTIYLYYNVRSKGHFDDWNNTDASNNYVNNVQASTASTTVVTFFTQYWSLRPGDQIDFQVDAITGYSFYSEERCGEQYQTIVGDSGWSNTQTITIGNSTLSTSTPSNSTAVTLEPTPTPIGPTQSGSTQNGSPFVNSTATPNPPEAQEGVASSFSLEQIAIIVMAVVIAVFAVVVVVLLRKASAIRVYPQAP